MTGTESPWVTWRPRKAADARNDSDDLGPLPETGPFPLSENREIDPIFPLTDSVKDVIV